MTVFPMSSVANRFIRAPRAYPRELILPYGRRGSLKA